MHEVPVGQTFGPQGTPPLMVGLEVGLLEVGLLEVGLLSIVA